MTVSVAMENFDREQAEAIARVEAAIEAYRQGKMLVLTDDEDRENEGDIILAAEHATPELINFMAVEARGLICLCLTGERLDELGIPMMKSQNQGEFGTAFTVSIEARYGVTTGISAADRARTVQVAVADETTPADLVMPGHIFPLRYRDGGVLVRTGQTEGCVDLAKLAGLKPAAICCEIMNLDGTMSRRPELEEFCETHDILMLSVADIIVYRLRTESLIEAVSDAPFPTEYPGDWRVVAYKNRVDETEHLAFICGQPTPEEPTLIRVQHRWDTFDAFMSKRSDALENLRGAMQAVGEAGTGVVLYLERAPRKASELLASYVDVEETGGKKPLNVVPEHQKVDVNLPDSTLRDLGIGSQILAEIGVGKMRVLTNRPKKIIGTEAYGLEVIEQVSIPDVD